MRGRDGGIIGAPHVILKIYEVYPYTIYSSKYRGKPYIFLELHGERLLAEYATERQIFNFVKMKVIKLFLKSHLKFIFKHVPS